MDAKEKDINLNILPKIGLQFNTTQLLFGISMEDVKAILGEADKIYITDENNIRWQYYHYNIEFSFEKNDSYKLGWIEVYNKEVKIFGQKFIGQKKDKVIRYFNTKLNATPEHNDYHSFESIFYEKSWIEFQFQFDKLYNINFGS